MHMIEYVGQPGASSTVDHIHSVENAFQKLGVVPWASRNIPVIIWYEFTKPYKISMISLSIRNPKGWCNNNLAKCFDQSPKEFEIIGSNGCKKWKTVLKINDAMFSFVGQSK